MKTIFTAVLICFALSMSAQKKSESTEFRVYFSEPVQLVQLDDTANQMWVDAGDVIKIRVHRDADPLHLIVATETTRGNLLLVPSEKGKVLANWEGVDTVLE